MTLYQLIPYYRGVYFNAVALKKRFTEMDSGGREAFDEVDRYQGLTSGYMEAIRETRKQKNAR